MEDIRILGLMRCLLAVCGPCVLGFCWTEAAHAEALWKRHQPEQGLLFYDTQARRVGDLLTVVVREDSNVRNQDNRGLGKKTSMKSLFKFGAKSDGGFSTQASEGEMDSSPLSVGTLTWRSLAIGHRKRDMTLSGTSSSTMASNIRLPR